MKKQESDFGKRMRDFDFVVVSQTEEKSKPTTVLPKGEQVIPVKPA